MNIYDPVSSIKGIGPKKTELLAKAGILSVRDLLYYLPRAYTDLQNATSIAELEPGFVTVSARVSDVKVSRKRGRMTLTEAILEDDTGKLRAIWFNQPYRAKSFEGDGEYLFSGKMEFSYGRFQLTNPSVQKASDTRPTHTNQYRPVYPASGQLKTANFEKALAECRNIMALADDMIPDFSGRADALLAVHFPESENDSRAGRDYLATEELFCLILAARLNANEHSKLRAEPISADIAALKTIIGGLPYQLTDCQRRSLWEIIQDLAKDQPMNRLLQGDVGSGKTLVAALSAFVASRGMGQVAILAPTEVLAAQHAESFQALLGKVTNIALLTGSTKHKTELKRHIKSGEVDIVIGTHALLTDDTEFQRLSLVVIDEQHRFGVAQRQKLLEKATKMPHLLSMTATPIPRSLQLTMFGDVAVSVLDQLPAGRKPITTKIISANATDRMWRDIETELGAGHQVYYICKKIEEGDSELSSVKTEAQKIAKRLKAYRVEYLHGKMTPSEKDDIMRRFSSGEIDVLVSTTVVEVGVNVPNATIIAIADADQYGLSQLHQLRGRVGRGSAESFCYLLTAKDNPSRRLREIENSQDGFRLAEIDLEMRGPGEVYGAIQHGALDLRIASISDTRLIHKASAMVDKFLSKHYNLDNLQELKSCIEKYQRITTLN